MPGKFYYRLIAPSSMKVHLHCTLYVIYSYSLFMYLFILVKNEIWKKHRLKNIFVRVLSLKNRITLSIEHWVRRWICRLTLDITLCSNHVLLFTSTYFQISKWLENTNVPIHEHTAQRTKCMSIFNLHYKVMQYNV